jgi:hypothetical protein
MQWAGAYSRGVCGDVQGHPVERGGNTSRAPGWNVADRALNGALDMIEEAQARLTPTCVRMRGRCRDQRTRPKDTSKGAARGRRSFTPLPSHPFPNSETLSRSTSVSVSNPQSLEQIGCYLHSRPLKHIGCYLQWLRHGLKPMSAYSLGVRAPQFRTCSRPISPSAHLIMIVRAQLYQWQSNYDVTKSGAWWETSSGLLRSHGEDKVYCLTSCGPVLRTG